MYVVCVYVYVGDAVLMVFLHYPVHYLIKDLLRSITNIKYK